MRNPKFTRVNADGIKLKFIEKVREENGDAAFSYRKRKRAAAVLLAAALALLVSFGTAAATGIIDMSTVYASFLGEGSEGSGFSINTDDTQSGIQVNLLSAVMDGKNGYLFLSFKDLEGDRLKDEIGWDIFTFKTYGWFKGGAGNSGFDILGYDEAGKTLSAVMRIQSSKDFKTGDKLTLTIHGFETEFARTEDNVIELDFYKLLTERAAPQTTTEYAEEIASWSAKIGDDITEEQIKEIPLLKKNELNISIDGVNSDVISNMGFVDGKLHIQYRQTDNWRGYNNAYFKLRGLDGEPINDVNSVSLLDSASGEKYEEHIYDVASPEELKGITFLADISSSKEYVSGPWELDFKIDSQTEHREFKLDYIADKSAKNVEIDASSISTVVSFDVELRKFISPDGFHDNQDALLEQVKVARIGNETENYLKLTDGGTVELKMEEGMLDYEANKGSFHFYHSFYDVSKLKSIVLDGEEYMLG